MPDKATTTGDILDHLIAAATKVSRTDFAHCDIQVNAYNVTVILRDAEPSEVRTEDGDRVTEYVGQMIAAGSAPTLDGALSAAGTALARHIEDGAR